jgi:hypothetical protein
MLLRSFVRTAVRSGGGHAALCVITLFVVFIAWLAGWLAGMHNS